MQRLTTTHNRKFAAFVLAIFVLALAGIMVAQSVTVNAPSAGTAIGNQASASYTDGSNISRTATSNTVKTTVAQVYALSLASDSSKTAAPGAQVVYAHTLTNKGNGSDSYTLAIANVGGAGTNYNFSSMFIYADANCDGVADNTTNLNGTNVTLSSYNATYCFVAVGVVPASATSGDIGKFKVTATSVGDGTQTTFNTDTTTASGNAVLAVTKAMSQNTGASPSGPYTVTLTYTNNGNATATAAVLKDALPTGMTVVSNSGKWSVTGSTLINDNTTVGTGTTLNYAVSGNTVTATINSIAPGVSGTVSFNVNIGSGVAPGTLANTAQFQYNDGTAVVPSAATFFNTNTVNFSVTQTAAVSITGQTIASAAQGASVLFTNPVTNNGTGTDTFNITLSGSTFPAGTTFQLFKSDGVTPLLDTNSVADGIPDTGPMAAGAVYNVKVKAILPASATGGSYFVNVTATSTFDGTKTSTAADTLTAITANTVDLTDATARSDSSPAGTATTGNNGFGAGPEASAVDPKAGNPGATLYYTLYVNNTSAQADTFDLTAGNNAAASSLNAGWSVVFRQTTAANTGSTVCSATNLSTTITNTGVVNGGANTVVCAVVTLPNSYPNDAAGTFDLYFKAASPSSLTTDTLHDAATINTYHNVTLTPNNTGQVFPGGSVTYTHQLVNNGNVNESITFATPTADSLSGWSSTLYRDNGTTPGALDSSDSAVSGSTTFTLNAGTSATMFAKVTAPSGAAIGNIDGTTVTVQFNGTSTAVATDSSTVIAGELRLVKEQQLNAACDGTAVAANWTQNDILATAGAKPGSCILYRITATNQGTANVASVVVSDSTPAFTTYTTFSGAAAAATSQGTITAPANGGTGTIQATVGTIVPLQSVTMTFGVKINP